MQDVLEKINRSTFDRLQGKEVVGLERDAVFKV
jgi:hypothetical protein